MVVEEALHIPEHQEEAPRTQVVPEAAHHMHLEEEHRIVVEAPLQRSYFVQSAVLHGSPVVDRYTAPLPVLLQEMVLHMNPPELPEEVIHSKHSVVAVPHKQLVVETHTQLAAEVHSLDLDYQNQASQT
jgi:hypothetical protein